MYFGAAVIRSKENRLYELKSKLDFEMFAFESSSLLSIDLLASDAH